MALTKLPRNAIGTGAIDNTKIEDGTIQNAELAGSLPETKLATSTIANAKLSNSTITVRGTSRALGDSFSLQVDVDWQSVQTGDFTAVAGEGYFINTTSGAITVTLPASASIGDQIAIKDYAGTFATNNLTIARNGHNIQGVANNSLISTNRASLVLVYVDATKGWLFTDEHNVGALGQALFTSATGGTVTTDGDYKIHTFTGDADFIVATTGNSPIIPAGGPNTVEYFVVGGGGGAGGGNATGGGGGAGGYRTNFPTACGLVITSTTYPVSVGAGGSGNPGTPCSANGTKGSDSIFSTITSAGGGGSFAAPVGPGLAPSNANGGSGGGPNYNGSYPQPFPPSPSGATNPSNYSVYPGSLKGAGNTPPVSPPQGNPSGGGGFNDNGPTSHYGGGGGGGAGGVGGNFNVLSGGTSPTPLHAGDGGVGAGISIFPAPIAPSYGTPGPSGPLRYFAGGGGASGRGAYDSLPPFRAGNGGYGGGGSAAVSNYPGPWNPRSSNGSGVTTSTGQSGTTNTGGGGGHGGKDTSCVQGAGGAGGSGIVVIRYKFQ
jgi:hypothetical protein